ncbi:hypothetical protein HRF87_27605, partial [Bacillus sp. CRN 9]|nr:hypothetical protein [Bacillus sp. CRN 9]
MKKLSFIFFTSLLVLSSLLFTSSASASSSEIDYDADPRDNPNLIEGVDYDIETIEVDFAEEIDGEPATEDSEFVEINPFMVVMPGPLWKTTDIKNLGTVKGGKIWDTDGKPGMTLSTTFTKNVTATVSTTYGATASALSQNLSFTIGKSYGVSSSGSYKVPTKHNGKNVKSVTLRAYSKQQKYSMKVHKRNDILYRYDYKGTTNAFKPVGVIFDYIHY